MDREWRCSSSDLTLHSTYPPAILLPLASHRHGLASAQQRNPYRGCPLLHVVMLKGVAALPASNPDAIIHIRGIQASVCLCFCRIYYLLAIANPLLKTEARSVVLESKSLCCPSNFILVVIIAELVINARSLARGRTRRHAAFRPLSLWFTGPLSFHAIGRSCKCPVIFDK